MQLCYYRVTATSTWTSTVQAHSEYFRKIILFVLLCFSSRLSRRIGPVHKKLTHYLAKFTTSCSTTVSSRIKSDNIAPFNHLNSKRLTAWGTKAAVSPRLNATRTRRPQKQSHEDTHPANLLLQHMLRAFLCSICQDRIGGHWQKELTTVILNGFCLPISIKFYKDNIPSSMSVHMNKETSINSLLFSYWS